MFLAHDVFVSYSSADQATADAVVGTLEQQKIRCWIAPRDVPAGRGYGGALLQAISECSVLVLVFSAKANASPHVMREIERAASKNIPILPLRIEDVPLSKDMEFFISSTHWLDALTPPLERHLGQLAASVKALLDTGGGPPEPSAVSLELSPPAASSPFGARLSATSYELTVRNGSEEALDVHLAVEDPGNSCAITLPARLSVGAGGTETVSVSISPRKRRWRGDNIIRPFTITASGGGQPPSSVSGQYEDVPFGWLPYGVGALAGLILAGVVGVAVAAGGGGDTGGDTVVATSTRQAQVVASPASSSGQAPPVQQDAPTPVPDGRPVELTTTTATGKIAFTMGESGLGSDIYVINVDGTGLTNLTNSEFIDEDYPAWSPDGSQIAFVSNRDDDIAIYIMNADGSNPRRLTSGSSPAWSPDGDRIAFVENGDLDGEPAWQYVYRSSVWDISTISVDGTGLRNLTNHVPRSQRGQGLYGVQDGSAYPTWSPDGRIAFASVRSRNGSDDVETFFWDIYVIDADGSNEVRLTDNIEQESDLAWSPDGARIAFSQFVAGDPWIYVIDVEGAAAPEPILEDGRYFSGRQRVEPDAPAWSPDGNHIALADDRPSDTYVMTSDGSAITDITPDQDLPWANPAWSPVD